MFEEAAHILPALGVMTGTPKLDLPAMMKHKDDTVAANVNGVAFLFKKNKIEPFIGTGRIAAPGKVEVTSEDGKTQTLETKNIVIATGSDVAKLRDKDGKAVTLSEYKGKNVVLVFYLGEECPHCMQDVGFRECRPAFAATVLRLP